MGYDVSGKIEQEFIAGILMKFESVLEEY